MAIVLDTVSVAVVNLEGGISTLEFVGGNLKLTNAAGVLMDVPPWSVGELIINAEDGEDDTLVIDFGGGLWYPANRIQFNGNLGGNDALEISGGNFTDIVTAYRNANDGTVNLNSYLEGFEVQYGVEFTGLSPVLINVGSVDNAVFKLPLGPEPGRADRRQR